MDGESTHDLAVSWEADSSIRVRARKNGQISSWPTNESIGVPSSKAMTFNVKALELLASWWVAQKTQPQHRSHEI